MPTPTSMLHVRVDRKIKQEATETLESMGLSVSDAVRLFLRRVVTDRAIPFEIRAPNTATREGMAEAEDIVKSRRGRFAAADPLFADLEKARRD